MHFSFSKGWWRLSALAELAVAEPRKWAFCPSHSYKGKLHDHPWPHLSALLWECGCVITFERQSLRTKSILLWKITNWPGQCWPFDLQRVVSTDNTSHLVRSLSNSIIQILTQTGWYCFIFSGLLRVIRRVKSIIRAHVGLQFALVLVSLKISTSKTVVLHGLLLSGKCLLFPLTPFLLGGFFVVVVNFSSWSSFWSERSANGWAVVRVGKSYNLLLGHGATLEFLTLRKVLLF